MPVFAGDLQYNWESNFIKIESLDKINSVNPDKIVNDDYNAYLNNGKSFYGYILYIKQQYQDLPDTNLNKKYADMLFNNYHLRLKAVNTNTYLVGIIDIPDSEYQRLDDDIKMFICIFNYSFAQDI